MSDWAINIYIYIYAYICIFDYVYFFSNKVWNKKIWGRYCLLSIVHILSPLTLGLGPSRPIISWKYLLKVNLICLTYWISEFSLAYLKCAQNTCTLAYSGQNHLTQSLFYNKVLNISCNLLNTLLKVENRMLLWVQNGCQCISCLILWSHSWPVTLAQGHWPVSWENAGHISKEQEKIKIQDLK